MITVDPGVAYFAWAVWNAGTLKACGVWREGDAYPEGFSGPVVVEIPGVHP